MGNAAAGVAPKIAPGGEGTGPLGVVYAEQGTEGKTFNGSGYGRDLGQSR